MKKFGLGKKDGDEDSNRSKLFGGRSKDKSPKPQTNPYAQLPTQGDAYNQAKARAGVPGYARAPSSAPPAQIAGRGVTNGYGDDKKSTGLGEGPSRDRDGYAADRYGTQNGYGGDRYGASAGVSQAESGASRFGPGGTYISYPFFTYLKLTEFLTVKPHQVMGG